jgi:hypothetical protein
MNKQALARPENAQNHCEAEWHEINCWTTRKGDMRLLISILLRLGLGERSDKKEARPARVAGAGLENIETMHGPEPIQTAETL